MSEKSDGIGWFLLLVLIGSVIWFLVQTVIFHEQRIDRLERQLMGAEACE